MEQQVQCRHSVVKQVKQELGQVWSLACFLACLLADVLPLWSFPASRLRSDSGGMKTAVAAVDSLTRALTAVASLPTASRKPVSWRLLWQPFASSLYSLDHWQMNLASTFVNDPTNSRLKFTRFSEPKPGDTMLAAMPILTAVPALAARVADGGAVLPAVHVRRIHSTATVMDSGLTCPKVQ